MSDDQKRPTVGGSMRQVMQVSAQGVGVLVRMAIERGIRDELGETDLAERVLESVARELARTAGLIRW